MGRIINESGIPDEELVNHMPTIMREVARWTEGMVTRNTPLKPGLFNRDGYVAPDSPYSQFKVARAAVANDNVVSGVLEVTQGLTFQGLKWEGDNSDEVDVFNQLSADLNLDNFVRQWFAEDYTYSQCVVGMVWGTETYKVRGYNVTPAQPETVTDEMGNKSFSPQMDPNTGKPMKPKKVKKKKSYTVQVPIGLEMLDPMKVIPVSPTVFGGDRLVWQSNPSEMAYVERVKNGEIYDIAMQSFFLGRYTPDKGEAQELLKMGAMVDYLLELDPRHVFRISPNKKSYERFADLRLRSVFPLLDLKQQLLEADRVALVGQANYILLIKKGDKDQPAAPAELANLREGVHNLAKVPVIVGDHRLNIEIITPDQSFSLNEERYQVLDSRILKRCLGAFTADDSSDGQTISRVIARVLENRRHGLKRELEDKIAKAVVKANPGTFEEAPKLTFMPRNVQLDSDSQIVQAVMALRTQKELSRETILEYFGFDQAVEANRREYEEESGLDEIFGTTVPFSSPEQGGTPQQNGATGGRPPGGGSTPNSPQAKTKPRTATGNKTSGGK